MTTPIDPGDTAALGEHALEGAKDHLKHMEGYRGEWDTSPATIAYWQAIADAVARAVCPPDCVVVRRDDLETALYGSQYWGEELRQDGEQEALDRLRALIGDE